MPTIEKLIGPVRLVALGNVHYVGVALMTALCIGVPLIVAYLINLLSSVYPIGSYLGLSASQR